MFNARLDSQILDGTHKTPITPDMSSEKLIDKYGVLNNNDGELFCKKYGSQQLTDDDIDVKKIVNINIDLDEEESKKTIKKTAIKSKNK